MYKYIFVVTCPVLNQPPNLQVHYSNDPIPGEGYPVDTTASFTCVNGYFLSGTTFSTCEISGNWNQETPTCNHSNDNNTSFKQLQKCVLYIPVLTVQFI